MNHQGKTCNFGGKTMSNKVFLKDTMIYTIFEEKKESSVEDKV